MTRPRKLREVLNVRLDEPLAQEIARIAGAQGRSESDIARMLLGYGIEVVRRLEVEDLSRPFHWQEEQARLPLDERWPEIVDITAHRRRMTDEEVDRHGLRGFVGGYPEHDPRWSAD